MALGRRYWTLWCSSAVANLGDGVFQVAIALLAVRLTRSPALVAGVALAARLPWLFVALPAGALAVASAAGASSIGLLYAVSVGLGVAEVLFDTSSQTLMPAVVEKHELSRANGRLFAVEMVMNQFVGPPLGGVLVAASAAIAIGSSAALYLVAAVVLALLPGTYRTTRQGPPTRLREDIGDGLRYLFSHRLLRTLGLLLGAQNLLFTAQGALFVLYATSDSYGLGLSDVGVGLLFTLMAVGGIAGSFAGAPIERRLGRAGVLTLALVVGGITLAIPGFTRNIWVVGASGLLTGTASMWNVVTVSLRQRVIPDHLLGRVNSAYRLLGWGSMPIGAGLGGVVGELVGVRAVFLLTGGLVVLLVVPLRAIVTDAAIEAAERSAPLSAKSGGGAGATAG